MRYGIVITPGEYEQASRSGYDYVEFGGRQIAAMTDAEFDALCGRIQACAKPCGGLNAYCPPEVAIIGQTYERAKAQEYAKRLAKRAKVLGAAVVGVGSPKSRMLAAGYPYDKAWDQAREFMQVTADAFGKYDIRVCVEALGTCYCNFINRLSEAAKLCVAAHRPNLGVVVDFYNMEHQQEADIALTPYAGRIYHAHISDDAGSPQQRAYLKADKVRQHNARLKRLSDTGYNGGVTLEIDVAYDWKAAEESLSLMKQAIQR